MSDFTTIPKVDLQQFIQGDTNQRQAFVTALGDAFRDIGFVIVQNHGIPTDLVEDFYQSSLKFFYLPKEVKLKYEVSGLAGQRGYTAFGKEHAKQSDVGDLKEFFQFGQTIDGDDPIKSEYPENVFVEDVPNLSKEGLRLFKAFEASGSRLLEAIALYLGLDKAYFSERIYHGNSILRTIYYPPIMSEPLTAIRAEQHEDINLITLLVGASSGGLQVQNLAGEWIAVVPEENEIAINVGDMLQRLTNNYLKSTTHRVINPPKDKWHEERLSIPFFLHPRSETDLSCLPECVSAERPIAYAPITAGEYLDERLREIGLKD
ncbi:MAG TPA: isopenicillin N synthase family oxygenase [Saprospiraceae bacterium]|nr:isopenicillin N synthase family oxygenase [Saprospiraceae bacterium]